MKSTKCHYSNIRKLGYTLTGPSIAELRIGRGYFSKKEMVLYTGILLSYSFVTPGLCIVDFLPYATNIYNQSQRDFTVALRALQKFHDLLPLCLHWLDLERVSAAIRGIHNQTERFGHFVQLVHRTLSCRRLVSISPTYTLGITERKASAKSPTNPLAIIKGRALTKSGDEI
jgi:hypothetical protein